MASSKTKGTQAQKQGAAAAQKAAVPSKDGAKASPAHAAGKGKAAAKAPQRRAKKGAKPGIIARAKAYFKSVGVEMRRVVWPSKQEMVKYTGAVIGMLLFFGILIALVDAAIVPVLYAFSGLR